MKQPRTIPIRVASSKFVLQRTWSIGVIVPCLVPLFWILRMLYKSDNKMAKIVPAMVRTVALLIFTWSKPFITSSLNGPIFTIKRNATKPSAHTTRKNKGIIFATTQSQLSYKTKPSFNFFYWGSVFMGIKETPHLFQVNFLKKCAS